MDDETLNLLKQKRDEYQQAANEHLKNSETSKRLADTNFGAFEAIDTLIKELTKEAGY